MGEHIFRVLLEELQTARVRCKTCNGVTEVPLENLEAVFENSKCPCCNADIGGGIQDIGTGWSLCC